MRRLEIALLIVGGLIVSIALSFWIGPPLIEQAHHAKMRSEFSVTEDKSLWLSRPEHLRIKINQSRRTGDRFGHSISGNYSNQCESFCQRLLLSREVKTFGQIGRSSTNASTEFWLSQEDGCVSDSRILEPILELQNAAVQGICILGGPHIERPGTVTLIVQDIPGALAEKERRNVYSLRTQSISILRNDTASTDEIYLERRLSSKPRFAPLIPALAGEEYSEDCSNFSCLAFRGFSTVRITKGQRPLAVSTILQTRLGYSLEVPNPAKSFPPDNYPEISRNAYVIAQRLSRGTSTLDTTTKAALNSWRAMIKPPYGRYEWTEQDIETARILLSLDHPEIDHLDGIVTSIRNALSAEQALSLLPEVVGMIGRGDSIGEDNGRLLYTLPDEELKPYEDTLWPHVLSWRETERPELIEIAGKLNRDPSQVFAQAAMGDSNEARAAIIGICYTSEIWRGKQIPHVVQILDALNSKLYERVGEKELNIYLAGVALLEKLGAEDEALKARVRIDIWPPAAFGYAERYENEIFDIYEQLDGWRGRIALGERCWF